MGLLEAVSLIIIVVSLDVSDSHMKTFFTILFFMQFILLID